MSRGSEIVLDCHTHTIASGHAYNTINEMIHSAADKGLKLLGITEHAPAMVGTCDEIYFQNFRVLHREKYGVKLLFGAELNILDEQGTLDLAEWSMAELDVGIASMHPPCYTSISREANTNAYIAAMKEPHVNIIGHPDDGRFPVDELALVQAAKEHHVLIELNNNSLRPNAFRKDSRTIDEKILTHCKAYQVPIILGSDAHVEEDIARYDFAEEILAQVDFPKELIVNYSVEQFLEFVPFAKC